MNLVLSTFFLFFLIIIAFTRQKKFGKTPRGKRLAQIRQSPHYKKGTFQNLHHTPALTEGSGFFSVMKKFLFERNKRITPVDPIPSVKTDLRSLDIQQDLLVWFGHSSYFMQVDGKRILVDPVFSGAASPLPFGTKAFAGSNIYSAADMPVIDYLFISHDHWDHLDYQTTLQLKPTAKKVICSLGTAEHLVYWGFDETIIFEKDWNEKIVLDDGYTVNTVPARHFSGRSFQRNKAQWTSYVLQTPSMQIFIGGDSGYDTHFADIGEKYGPFDLVILENGQYDKSWRYIHMLPEEFLLAAKDLKAKKILPVHSSKFALGNHAWDEPLIKLMENNKQFNMAIITPMIGELVRLKDESQQFSQWWVGIN